MTLTQAGPGHGRQPATTPDGEGDAIAYADSGVIPGTWPPGGPARRDPAAGLLVAGAHGGAGTSTLAALIREQLGAGMPVYELPACPDSDPAAVAAATALPAMAGPVIVVARGTSEGARRAVIAVTVLELVGIRPAALAVTGDGAGPLPRAAMQRLAALDGRVGAVIRVPFAAELRALGYSQQMRLPARLVRAVTDVLAAALPAAPAARGSWR